MGLHMPGEYEQLKALDYLMRDGEHSGRDLRNKINADLLNETELRRNLTRAYCGWLLTMSAPAFYQMMVRMEQNDEVEGWYKEIAVADTKIKERWYRVKEGGMRRFEESPSLNTLPDFQIGWVMG